MTMVNIWVLPNSVVRAVIVVPFCDVLITIVVLDKEAHGQVPSHSMELDSWA